MQGKIEKIGYSKKGNPIIKVGGVDYFARTPDPKFVEGKEIIFEFTKSNFKGKDYNWITENTVFEVEPGKSKGGFDTSDKNRSFAAAYAKDLVVAGKEDLSHWELLADRIYTWLTGSKDEEFPPEE